MLGFDIIRTAGAIVKHFLGVLLLCWQRMMRAALISWVMGFVLVEIIGSITSHQIIAPTMTHVVALIFAFVLAYSIMLTVLIDEFIIGAIDTVKVLEGDVQAGARAAAVAAERDAGEAGGGFMALLGHAPRVPRRRTPARAKTVPQKAAPRTTTSTDFASTTPHTAAEQYVQTQADIDATDEFSNTAPRPRVNAQPVRADQLPRIGWAFDQLERQERASTSLNAQNDHAGTEEVDQQNELPFVIAPHIVPASQMHLQEPLGSSPSDEEQTSQYGGTFSASDGYTSAASAYGEAGDQRSIWSRISKALVGDVHPPAIPQPDALYHEDLPAN